LEFLQGKPPEEIANFLVRKDGSVHANPVRPALGTRELDGFPFVSDFFRRHLDFGNYRTPSEPHPFVDTLAGRGCVWGLCTFCLWVHTFIKGRTYIGRSVGSVLEEFSWIERKMSSVRSVMIQDDTFPEERAAAFSEAKIRAGVKLRWSCYARAEFGLETLRLMKSAGCLNLYVGFESGDDRILRAVRKGLTKERMTRFMGGRAEGQAPRPWGLRDRLSGRDEGQREEDGRMGPPAPALHGPIPVDDPLPRNAVSQGDRKARVAFGRGARLPEAFRSGDGAPGEKGLPPFLSEPPLHCAGPATPR
jgi:hypothetical protein